MINKRKSTWLILAFILILSLGGCGTKTKHENSSFEPINKLISILYFNKGTYEDYKALFTNSSLAFSENQFNEFRKKPDKSSFKYGANSSDEIMSHMKAVPNDANFATVYYVEDVDKSDESKAPLQWKVENRDGKWLLKND
ncbi:hypothetical protein GOM49_12770 [Clostridium bovifaecis]|uniref:DUF4878 domain-containing protein n=1 Tax=Clostridium bovifaecis TaxID=2184719 RepID=A0A6I6F3T8_9CLOT|nr:hypothetical protein GOM49_12770 [Clostridium bovifaecis]